jgi:dTDP-4-amino-4,6-dideoxygalactose transaminase
MLEPAVRFRIIEDACHALGASLSRRTRPAMAATATSHFQLPPVKIITTGEGGMAMTNDARCQTMRPAAQPMASPREAEDFIKPAGTAPVHEQQRLGFNNR